jgi:uncharacterized protein
VTGVNEVVALVCAGAVAGAVGTAGGITSLISYPSLLAVGLAAFPANVANMVAVVACWPGSAMASRPELHGSAKWLRHWTLVTAAGGAIGAALFLSTPAGTFVRIVPFLVAGASLILLLQPRVYAWQGHRLARVGKGVFPAGLLVVTIYNGYFGAGSGIMLLALLLLLVEQHLAKANALKNMLLGAATAVPALAFVLFASVEWSAVLPLAAGMFAGSMVGPRVARRLPAHLLRWVVAIVGFGLATWLWVHSG